MRVLQNKTGVRSTVQEIAIPQELATHRAPETRMEDSEMMQETEVSGLMKVRSQELIQGPEAAVSEMMWEQKKVPSEMPRQKEK